MTDAIFEVFAPIEASAFTPDEWKSKKSLITDYAENGLLV
ncbi:conserved domain protein [delta proteobacterium NaphS2]|nr:conserved domain protein [delta proteobacterium NaphS2]